jgi:membrane-associated protease RseP (regulator of RpoE activity)
MNAMLVRRCPFVISSALSLIVFAFFAQPTQAQEFLKSLQEKFQQLGESQPPPPSPQTEPPANPPSDVPVESETLPAPKPASETPSPTNPFLLPSDSSTDASKLELGPSAVPNTNTDVIGGPVELPLESDSEIDDSNGAYLGLVAEQAVGGGMGLRVVEVAKDSPAWKAGFQVGDRMLAVGGKAIRSLDDLATQISSQPVNQATRILINRGGRNMEMVVVMMDRSIASRIAPSDPSFPDSTLFPSGDPEVNGNSTPYFGVTIANLNAEFRREYRVPVFRGAAITSVTPGSPAHRAGMLPGDCVVEANGQIIQSSQELQELIAAERPGQLLQLAYYRERELISVMVPLGSTASSRMNFSQDSLAGGQFGASPEYVRDLQNELIRVQRELAETQLRLKQLEERLNESDRRRRR